MQESPEKQRNGVNEERLVQAALACGADRVALIRQEDVALDGMFRGMCEANRCGLFGRCYMCPPDVGPIDRLMGRLRGYERGLLYSLIAPLRDSFDVEGMEAGKRRMVQVSQALLDALGPLLGDGALHLSCGGCGLCVQCARVMDEPCHHPDRAMASLESYGVDVYTTARNAGLAYTNGPNTVTYFGLVLYGEREDG